VKLRHRISWFVIPTVVVLTGTAGWFILASIEAYHDEQQRDSVLGLARTISLSLRREPDLSDARRLHSFIEQLRDSDPRILEATIVDDRGEITGDLEAARVFAPATDEDLLAVLHGGGAVSRATRRGSSVFEATVPIFFPGSESLLGVFRLRYDTSSTQAIHQTARLRMLLAVAAIAVLLVIGLRAALDRSVVRPLTAFVGHAGAVASGDFKARVPAQSTIELEDLRKSFNVMAESLETSLAAVEERTGQLLHAERLSAAGTLASGVAHEINNPLATILTCSEGLLRSLAAERPAVPGAAGEKLAPYLSMIRDEAKRCRAITAQLLDVSRKRAAPASPLDLNAVVSEAISLARPRAEAETKIVESAPATGPLLVVGNADALKQLLINLISNALDASGPGGVVRVRASEAGGLVRLEIEDHGRGLTAEEEARALEPFFTTKTGGRGTGLGLAICDVIVHEHRGRMQLRSRGPGIGTRVTVSLPQAPKVAGGAA